MDKKNQSVVWGVLTQICCVVSFLGLAVFIYDSFYIQCIVAINIIMGVFNLIPAYPNAVYYVSGSNWDAGMNPSPRDSASYLDINYAPLQKAVKLEMVAENSIIKDGISTISVDGHTFGQQLIKLESEEETLIFCSDLIPLRSHLKLPWIMGYDLNAVLTLKEKTKFLKEAAENNWWLWFYHDPKTIAVRIKKSEKYYDVVDEVMRKFN